LPHDGHRRESACINLCGHWCWHGIICGISSGKRLLPTILWNCSG